VETVSWASASLFITVCAEAASSQKPGRADSFSSCRVSFSTAAMSKTHHYLGDAALQVCELLFDLLHLNPQELRARAPPAAMWARRSGSGIR
jgi:hypothetical protein